MKLRSQTSDGRRRRLQVERLEDRLLLSITVTTLVDENNGPQNGAGTSLREALSTVAPGESIFFDSSLYSGGPATISLTQGPLSINKRVALFGPGANNLTIEAIGNPGATSRIFAIDDGLAEDFIEVQIIGLRLEGGHTSAGNGGAIASRENLTISESIITGSVATGEGGAIYHALGDLTITNSTISDSTATGSGGALYLKSGNLTVIASTFDNNQAGTHGGAISAKLAAGNSALVSNSTISGNRSNDSGGGLLFETQAGAQARVEHSTIAFNSADANADGAGSSGGVRHEGAGAVTLSHTIVAQNEDQANQAEDLSGSFLVHHCLIGIGDGAALVESGGNLIGTVAAPFDPVLSPLSNYLGITETHALFSDSPAIDAGTVGEPGISGVPEFDQRGEHFTRVHNSRVDIGAYEWQPLGAAIFIVDTLLDESDANYGPGDLSLREAIELAHDSPRTDRLIRFNHSLFPSGMQSTLNLLHGELLIDASMSILGPGADVMRIDAGGDSRLFRVDAGRVAISGFTLTGGATTSGPGGAIHNAGDLTVAASVVTGNTSVGAGGGIFSNGLLTLVDSTVSSNIAQPDQYGYSIGGGVAADGAAVFDSVITGNEALASPVGSSRGGGLFLSGGYVHVWNSKISDNAAANGGGLYGYPDSFGAGDITITNSSISGNRANAGHGGGISTYDVTLNISDSAIYGNQAATNGGGIYAGGNFFRRGYLGISQVTISGNQAASGGGVYTYGPLTLASSTITNNQATAGGGIVLGTFAEPRISNSIVARNIAPAEPDIQGDLYQTSFSLVGNRLISNAIHWAPAAGGNGHYYELVIVPGGVSWSSANAAATAAGGYLATITSEAEGTFVFDRLVDNPDAWQIAEIVSYGPWLGGIQAANGLEPDGGWGWFTGEPMVYTNWFPAFNGYPKMPDELLPNQDRLHYATRHNNPELPPWRSAMWNDLHTASTRPIAYVIEYNALPGQTIADPMLGPLADNGGATLTHALLPGSPLINQGDPASVAGQDGVPVFDQRGPGFPRVRSDGGTGPARIDLGANEFGPSLPSGAYNADDVVDAADYTVWRDSLGTSVPAFSGADGNGNGLVDLGDFDIWKSNFGAAPAATAASGALNTTSLITDGAAVEAENKELPAIPNSQPVVNPAHGARSIYSEQAAVVRRLEPFTPSHQLELSKPAVFVLSFRKFRTQEWHGNDSKNPLTLICTGSSIQRRTLGSGGPERPGANNVDFNVNAEVIDHALSSLVTEKGWWQVID